ncbi:MAG: hemerythrin domain-containing protein [Hyphomicrobiales bacterium]
MTDPIAIIERVHKEHAAFCDILEEIADSLPEAVNCDQCASVLVFLRQELPQHHKDEEDGLFALLREKARKDGTLIGHLEQLSWEHSADESTAHEIAETLEKLACGEKADNPNMLGYMLRSFFEGYRRHLHWENTFLLPLARRRLSTEEMEMINAVMAENRFAVGANGASCDGNCHACKPKNVT